MSGMGKKLDAIPEKLLNSNHPLWNGEVWKDVKGDMWVRLIIANPEILETENGISCATVTMQYARFVTFAGDLLSTIGDGLLDKSKNDKDGVDNNLD